MHTEFEATYTNIDKEEIRSKLKALDAKLVKPEFLQKRVALFPAESLNLNRTWLRVRDESDKITMSIKWVDGDKIENQHEIGLIVDNFDNAVAFLEQLGSRLKAYQETKRELWHLDGLDITIDTWPFLEPLVEIEGKSEESVRQMSVKLGFDYADAYFGGIDTIYSRAYNISEDQINNHTPRIVFDEPNPFI